MGKTAGGSRAVRRALRPQTARQSFEPDGRMGQPAGLAREMGGPGRLTGQGARKCQAAGLAGQPEHAGQSDGPTCPRKRTFQAAGWARRPGHARAPDAPDWLARSPAVGSAGQLGGARNSGGTERRKMPGRQSAQSAGLDRLPGEPDCRMGQATERAGQPERAKRLDVSDGRKMPG